MVHKQTEAHRYKLSLSQPNIKSILKSELTDLYINQQLGTHAIAKKIGISQTTVRRWLKRYDIPERTKAEASKITRNGFKEEERHLNWKGDGVGYQALHTWVRKHLGTPKQCSHCQATHKKKYEWANISRQYKRELTDWVRLCTSCHRKYDKGELQLCLK